MMRQSMLFLSVAMLTGCAAGLNPASHTTAQRAEYCTPITETDVAGLFERWNASLQTGNPKAVVGNYAERSLLLPTLSSTPRLTKKDKEDYFVHFLASQPTGKVTTRQVDIGCNTVVDAGLYTFTMLRDGSQVQARYTFAYQWDGGQWLITSHHSSMLPSHQ